MRKFLFLFVFSAFAASAFAQVPPPWVLPPIPSALPPTGAAGGDLSGTYPNPGVAKVVGTAINSAPASGNLIGTTDTQTVANKILNGLTISPLTTPAAPTGTITLGTGSIGAGTYYYVITALDVQGETVKGTQSTGQVLASTGEVALTWTAITGATSYKVYRSTTSGTYTTPAYIANPTANSYTDTAASASSGAPPATDSSGTLTLNDPLSIANGGTGATSAGAALTALGTSAYNPAAVAITGGTATLTGLLTVHDATDSTKTWSPDTANMPTGMKYKNQIVYPIFSDTSGLTTQFAAGGTAVTGSNPLTLPLAKTWHIWGTVQTSLVSFTQTGLNQATCYLYTSNGAAAVADTTGIAMIPIGASITFAGPTIYLPPTDYTTSATTDQISVYCSSSLSTSSQLVINATSIHAR